jgi:hypothetical protein
MTSLPVNCQGVGSMEHPVRWDEETVAAYHMDNGHTARITLIVCFAV